MKYIIFSLLTFGFQFVLAAQTFTGFLSINNREYYFRPQNSKILYKIVPANQEVTNNLHRLSKDDLIAGNGSLDTVNKRLSLQSVDYVGLRRLLGGWVTSDGFIYFKDFQTMKFFPRSATLLNNATFIEGLQKEFRYSVSPSEDNKWDLFLSDKNTTTFATAEFRAQGVVLKLYSVDGEVVRTLRLERP